MNVHSPNGWNDGVVQPLARARCTINFLLISRIVWGRNEDIKALLAARLGAFEKKRAKGKYDEQRRG